MAENSINMDNPKDLDEKEPDQGSETKPSLAPKKTPEYFIPEINRLAAVYPHRLTEQGVIGLIVTSSTPEDIDFWPQIIGQELLSRGQVTEDIAENVGLRILSHFAKNSGNFLRTIYDISVAKKEAAARLEAWKARAAAGEREKTREELQQVLFDRELERRYARDGDIPKFSLTVTPASPVICAPAFQGRSRSAPSAATIVARISEYEQPSAWLPTGPQLAASESESESGSQKLLEGPDTTVAVARTFEEATTQTSQTDSDTELGESEESNFEISPQYPLMKFDFPPPGASFAASASPEVLKALEKFGPPPIKPVSKKRKRKNKNKPKPQPAKETKSFGTQTSPYLVMASPVRVPALPALPAPNPVSFPTLPSALTSKYAGDLGNPQNYRTSTFSQIYRQRDNAGKQPVQQQAGGQSTNTHQNNNLFGDALRRSSAFGGPAAYAGPLRMGSAPLKPNFGQPFMSATAPGNNVAQMGIVHTNPRFTPIHLLAEPLYPGVQQFTGNGLSGTPSTNTIGHLSEASTVTISSEIEIKDGEESELEDGEICSDDGTE
ncbi:hypothetical protein TWF106_003893 [Orbilia oligospora]|uniref:Uncharacterized protein n=1 Tax=Orbilia oligospora TaxID=2813651 RepID=A0A6G1ME64_ORBOL|nr:hypothetical protein TWF679_002360 [Orbilia oligospora]KAF3224428.1 hypothetical protein TWF106_003893 [Orbilia oligospora]KAF3231830.1 hypothetical protein TWF191_003809 [Orbilia oligospora]KAF3255768.1 hypothetical protein TWF192_002208 [Orbilia oligospora]